MMVALCLSVLHIYMCTHMYVYIKCHVPIYKKIKFISALRIDFWSHASKKTVNLWPSVNEITILHGWVLVHSTFDCHSESVVLKKFGRFICKLILIKGIFFVSLGNTVYIMEV